MLFGDSPSAHAATGGDQPVLSDTPTRPASREIELSDHEIRTPLHDLFEVDALTVRHHQGVIIQTPVHFVPKTSHTVASP